MDNFPSTSLKSLLASSKPWALLCAIITYALGAGIHKYLGADINWEVYWLGQACLTLLQVGGYFLAAYFINLAQPSVRKTWNSGRQNEKLTPASILLSAAFAAHTVCAVLMVLLYQHKVFSPGTIILLAVAIFLCFFYGTPPLRLIGTGYGELSQAIILANVFPALAFLFQSGDLHLLVFQLTFPLTAFILASTLAISLKDYPQDISTNQQTLLVRMGWERGMNLHHYLILGGFLFLALSGLVGLPWSLTWPVLLSLPVGIFQVRQINLIIKGARPRWALLKLTAGALVGMSSYLLTLALWTG